MEVRKGTVMVRGPCVRVVLITVHVPVGGWPDVVGVGFGTGNVDGLTSTHTTVVFAGFPGSVVVGTMVVWIVAPGKAGGAVCGGSPVTVSLITVVPGTMLTTGSQSTQL